MSKSTLADVVLTLLLVFEAETTSPSREGGAMRTAKVISESGQDLLWSFVARSLLHCHLLCVGNDRCDGFTFTRMSPTTQGWCQGWCRNSRQEATWNAVTSGVNYAIKLREFDLQQAATTQGQELDTQETSTATQVTDDNTPLDNSCETDDECTHLDSWMCHKNQCLCRAGYYYCQYKDECIASCSNTILRSDFVKYLGLYLSDPKLDNATFNLDESECESNCSKTADCRAFNYDRNSNKCQMVEEGMLLQAERDSFVADEYWGYQQKLCC